MTISFDLVGCYFEHKEFFDILANALQHAGHRVGIITGEREKDPYTGEDYKEKILPQLGFKPDFFHVWGAIETIVNGNSWKAHKMHQEGVAVHFDDDAKEIKRYTDLWVIKTMTNADPKKF